jgi:hypothetical protein
MPESFDLGAMVEGVVEIDPMTDHVVVRYETKAGPEVFDLNERLSKYRGQQVRCIVTPLSTVAKLAQMVEAGEIKMEEVPRVQKLG